MSRSQSKPWKFLRMAMAGWLFAVGVGGPVEAAGVSYEKKNLMRTPVHVITVDLNQPGVRVTPFVAQGFPGAAEDFASMIRRARPVAAINGTFFSKQTFKPTGDIVIGGRQLHFGGMGTALAIDSRKQAHIIRVPWGKHVDWTGYETVLACGPSLMKNGLAEVDADLEGFSDAHVLSPGVRSAVGVTEWNKLRLVCVPSAISLSKLAAIMAQLNCVQAMNLDGGASMAMYYRGQIVVAPGRALTNLLVVYEDGRQTPPVPEPASAPPPPAPPVQTDLPAPEEVPSDRETPPSPQPSADVPPDAGAPTPEPAPKPEPPPLEEKIPPDSIQAEEESPPPETAEVPAPPQEVPLPPAEDRSLLSLWTRLSRPEQIVVGVAMGLVLLGWLHFLVVTRAGAERLGGLGSLVRAGNAYLLNALLGTAFWLALLQFAFHAPPEVVSPEGATVGLALCLWIGLAVALLGGYNASDGAGYGTLAALLAGGGLIYSRHHPLLAPFADWTWGRLLLLSGGTGLLTGLCLGILLHRLQPRAS